ncbi:uncharacterized protein LOC113854829 [Abrus precatorius]|uniref:Uncharacterized protein LOC113854829 n=1 Tax=Abrus precatorius TaxID=3816 RepID=A0A8B8KDM6_ABRPR|nr:uncharacterized protein LOC113854829 [Abrus precatorius]
MAMHISFRSLSVSNSNQRASPLPLGERISEEPQLLPYKPAQSAVTCIYQAKIAGCWRNVSVLWRKNLISHTLKLKVDSTRGEFTYTCKIDVKPWYFWRKKGYKSFEVDGHQMEAYWDFRSAKFAGGSPEPRSNYYVALALDEEVVLLLGDYKNKAYNRMKLRAGLVEAVQFFKRENVFAKKSFSTKARFDWKKKESDIVVESSTFELKKPEMRITIDGIVLIHVKNLQWKFRGNQTVMVNNQPVQVYWDVHDWLFSGSRSGPGLFIFKTGPVEADNEKEENGLEFCDSDDGSSGYYSPKGHAPFESCYVLYAHKLES